MRSSVSSRVYVLGFSAFWCGSLVWVTVHGWPPSPRLALMRILGIAASHGVASQLRLALGRPAGGWLFHGCAVTAGVGGVG